MIRVLGPVQFVAPEGPTSPPSVAQRRLLAILALHAPEPVRADHLAELLDVSPSGLRTALTRLRKALGESAVKSTAAGYRVTGAVDAHIFCDDLAAATTATTPNPMARLGGLDAVLSLWRGPAFDEFADEDWAAGTAARLNELHAGATEDRAECLVEAHRCSEAIAELCDHIARHPLRDRPRGLLMRALAGDGRQADALRAFREYRQLLAEEVGTVPSEGVRLIDQRIAGGWTGTAADDEGDDSQRTAVTDGLPTPLTSARRGPFVGRADMIDELDDSWRGGGWRVLFVAGEPGIGKTRLLAELAHRMHQADRRVVVARGDEDFAFSYRPWTELLDSVISAMPPAVAEALEAEHPRALGRLVPSLRSRTSATADTSGGDAAAQRALILDAILAVLRAAGPTVLMLDDLHWFDAVSLGVLRRVASAAIPDLTIVGAYRDTDVTPADTLTAVLADLRRDDGVRRVTLDGIDAASVVALVERSSGRPLDAATISLGHAIHARTAGNPLFAGELIGHLVEKPRLPREETRDAQAPDVPLGLAEIIGRRLARLGEETVDALRVAAAVGERFDVGVVEETVALDRAHGGVADAHFDVLTLLERARDARVVVEDVDGMSFRHAVIRSALLDPMSAARLQRLHRDIASVLERRWSSALDRHVEALAFHHERARSPDAPRWYLRAADAAGRALDTRAAELAERGLELLTNGDEPDAELRCDLLIARAVGLRLAGREEIEDARRATDAPQLNELDARV